MRVRTSFVTNSSSTSYIIGLPTKSMRLVELLGVLDEIPFKGPDDYGDSSVFKEEIQNVEEYQREFCGCKKGTTCDSCGPVEEALQQGLRVFYINISYHDETGIYGRFEQFRKAYPETVIDDRN